MSETVDYFKSLDVALEEVEFVLPRISGGPEYTNSNDNDTLWKPFKDNFIDVPSSLVIEIRDAYADYLNKKCPQKRKVATRIIQDIDCTVRACKSILLHLQERFLTFTSNIDESADRQIVWESPRLDSSEWNKKDQTMLFALIHEMEKELYEKPIDVKILRKALKPLSKPPNKKLHPFIFMGSLDREPVAYCISNLSQSGASNIAALGIWKDLDEPIHRAALALGAIIKLDLSPNYRKTPRLEQTVTERSINCDEKLSESDYLI